MYTSKNTLKISDLRKHTVEVIEELKTTSSPVLVFSRSNPEMVVMSLEVYERLKNDSSRVKSGGDDANPKGLDFFIDTPEEFMFHKSGLDAVKLVRSLRK